MSVDNPEISVPNRSERVFIFTGIGKSLSENPCDAERNPRARKVQEREVIAAQVPVMTCYGFAVGAGLQMNGHR